MITLYETVTFKDGKTSTTEKAFQSHRAMKKALEKSPVSGKLSYEITKHGEAFVEYENARVHFKVAESDEDQEGHNADG